MSRRDDGIPFVSPFGAHFEELIKVRPSPVPPDTVACRWPECQFVELPQTEFTPTASNDKSVNTPPVKPRSTISSCHSWLPQANAFDPPPRVLFDPVKQALVRADWISQAAPPTIRSTSCLPYPTQSDLPPPVWHASVWATLISRILCVNRGRCLFGHY